MRQRTEASQRTIDMIGDDFNNIMTKDVKILIAEAFISLEADIRKNGRNSCRSLSEQEIQLLKRKANQMKHEIDDFIDSQKQRILDASIARGQNGFPDLE